MLSSTFRATLFFTTNLVAGFDAALAAMALEFVFRFATSGFYGALTQALRHVRPAALGTALALVGLPLIAHSLEFAVHWWRGTPALAASISISVMFTVVSTAFNLFAMRRGLLIVGAGERSLWQDVREMPRTLAQFLRLKVA